MRRSSGNAAKVVPDRHKSRFGNGMNHADSLGFSQVCPGQSRPRHCPYLRDANDSVGLSPLGEALTVDDVALLLGCSPWTVRQKYLPQGLPHVRASASGRFVFFRKQVVHWILERQEKGGWK